ncbi:hypothetical protein GQ651_05305 [Alphaproteobacteria bacterium GH1-50]|uniref:Uncharacterized protein n=1 Tax=Kangsaoukella pontilimi TaxID=2691042 RepID=A0A7C9MZ76_9RHOB|nr:hypothetical protein [Kangsaoukella pontilimi]MXQ07258.1 hypothetical protein [Kangsaoukella pontilimi]
MTGAHEFRPRAEIIAAFQPAFQDFTADFEAFFEFARQWGRDNADRLRAADEARGYSDEAIGAIERDYWGQNLFWLQGEYFARGLHDLVARHFIERPFWDREYRDLPWTVETGSNKRPAASDGIPLEELREAFARFEADGRPDLAAGIWLHVTEATLARDPDPQDAIETFDLCRGVVERCGTEADRARLDALKSALPD